MVVRDPNFWRRFSIAVHQDEAAKEEMTKRPDMKHSYVPSHSSPSRTPLAPSTPRTPLSLDIPPMALISPVAVHSPLSLPAMQSSPSERPSRQPQSPKRRRSKLQKTPSTKPLLRPSIQPSTDVPLSPPQPAFAATTRRPSFSHRSFNRYTNSSTLTLSGRPTTHRFWTTITADPSNRNSWLESQRKKRRQRTWICWIFWLCFLLLVAAIVTTLLILKSKKII
ncbi:hypothetical protein BKA66DRAFT_576424 [Pyrenochaeta sp. MPI-SDFR-AT-0127]|nr:hypothetical protein BKA66DRAFT_576424 [Pyrenochaeta sp. MPI-SDFR-AT-0127]